MSETGIPGTPETPETEEQQLAGNGAPSRESAGSERLARGRRDGPAKPIDLQIAVVEAAARIVAGPHSSHMMQDPDIAQGVAASFRTIYDAIIDAVQGKAPEPPTQRNEPAKAGRGPAEG